MNAVHVLPTCFCMHHSRSRYRIAYFTEFTKNNQTGLMVRKRIKEREEKRDKERQRQGIDRGKERKGRRRDEDTTKSDRHLNKDYKFFTYLLKFASVYFLSKGLHVHLFTRHHCAIKS